MEEVRVSSSGDVAKVCRGLDVSEREGRVSPKVERLWTIWGRRPGQGRSKEVGVWFGTHYI